MLSWGDCNFCWSWEDVGKERSEFGGIAKGVR